MKNNFYRILVVLLFMGNVCVINALAETTDESAEPQAHYELLINGEAHTIFPDKPITLEQSLEKPVVELRIMPFREFAYSSVSFKYPQYFAFDAELSDPSVKLWTLTGRETVIMVQKFSEPMNHSTMAAMIQPNYGDEISRIFPGEIELMNEKFEGSVIAAAFGGMALTQEIFSFDTDDGPVLIVIQNKVDQKGAKGQEGEEIRKLLKETFTISNLNQNEPSQVPADG